MAPLLTASRSSNSQPPQHLEMDRVTPREWTTLWRKGKYMCCSCWAGTSLRWILCKTQRYMSHVCSSRAPCIPSSKCDAVRLCHITCTVRYTVRQVLVMVSDLILSVKLLVMKKHVLCLYSLCLPQCVVQASCQHFSVNWILLDNLILFTYLPTYLLVFIIDICASISLHPTSAPSHTVMVME